MRFGPFPWQLDHDDLPCTILPPDVTTPWRWAPRPPTERPDTVAAWEHAPAALVVSSCYPATLPRSGSGGFVWSSLLDEITLDPNGPPPAPPVYTGLGPTVRRSA